MSIIEIINWIEADKKARNIFPTHATFREILKIHGRREEAVKELNNLYVEGKIKVGDTVNDKYIRIKR